MKLEVGQFVRFKDKRGIEYIRKIAEIPEDNRYASLYLDKEANYSCGLSPKNVIKTSYNIIDILEKGDYVNGKKIYSLGLTIGILNTINLEDGTLTIAEDIKSVVTKEQMEQMAYMVDDI